MAFDYNKLQALENLLKKAQFVPMDPSMAGGDPAAAGGMPPPGDPNAMPPPGDPAAGGMPPPGDPAAGGMPPPGDPAAGGMPPPGMDPSMMDPAAMGMPPPDSGDVSPTGEPYMKITPTQLSKLFKQFAEVFKSVLGISGPNQAVAGSPAPAAAPAQDPALSQKMTELDAKIDALLRG